MFLLGYEGMPRRYFDYLPQFHTLHFISTMGAWLMFIALSMVIGNLIYALRKGRKAPANPWGGVTLEWQTTSPPPLLNFEKLPENIPEDPYDFSQLKEMKYGID